MTKRNGLMVGGYFVVFTALGYLRAERRLSAEQRRLYHPNTARPCTFAH